MKKDILSLLKPLGSVLVNLLLVYVVYFLARIVFLLENWSMYAENLSAGHLLEMFRGGLIFDTSAILYTNVLWVVMVLFPLHFKERPVYHAVCRWTFVVINMLTLVVNLCDTVYFRYSMRRTTTTIFQEFENENNLGGIFLTEALSHWYFFVLAAVVGWALWKLYVKPNPSPSPSREEGSSALSSLSGEKGSSALSSLSGEKGSPGSSAQSPLLSGGAGGGVSYYLVMTLSLLVFAPFCVAGMRGGWTRDIRPITVSNANNYCDRPSETGIVLNTPFALIRTIGKNLYVVPEYFQSEEEMAQVFDPIHIPQSSKTAVGGDSVGLGRTFRAKNVVVIIIESFGREYIGAYNKHIPGYAGYTPFTDSLIAHGALTYRYSYCNGRKSIDGMPSILSSIPMFVEPFFLSPYSVNHVSGLADCLNGKGYETAFFHGAERGSMGFLAFARATKFKDYYGREDFKEDTRFRGDADYDGWWGISDEPFMQYYCTKMSEMKQPFMTALFTLSSHHPFRVPEPYKDVFKEENPDMPIYKVIRYTDMALQHFFESARKQPWYENTIFAITSDHTNMTYFEEYRTDIGGFCSPVIFYDPSGEMGSGMVDAIAQQTDIMPTILEHLGYDQPYLTFGIDLLNTPAEETWAVNYLNGIYQYVKYGHVMQFNGERVTAVYSLEDRLMKHNLLPELTNATPSDSTLFSLQSSVKTMELELKAIIQQYMERITENRLIPQ